MLIKKVSIQMSQSLICGGLAVVERNGRDRCIFFDVVKSLPIKVIVGSRGKDISEEDADLYEQELLDLFIRHQVPLKLGTYAITA